MSRATLKQTDDVEISKEDLWGTQSVSKIEACLCSRGVAGKLIQRVRGPYVISDGLVMSMKLRRVFWKDLRKILPDDIER